MASQSISFRPTTVIKQIPWSIDSKTALGLFLILATFSLVGLLYLGQASVITSSTLEIEKLQREIEAVNQQNAGLVLEIAELESLAQIKARATALGFVPTDPLNIRYLPVDNYPATTETPPPLMQPQSYSNEATQQSWADVLAAWLTGKPLK